MRSWGRPAAVAAIAIALTVAAPAARGADEGSSPYPGGIWWPPEASYGVGAAKNVTVPMSDGVNLVADVYFPTDPDSGEPVAKRFPVLLTQTPYTGSLGATALVDQRGPGAYFVERGYLYVAADVRGTGRSGGIGGFMSPRDALDGAELAAWAAALEGSNGVVGLHGCSYLGATQLYTAGALKPGTTPVKAMIPACVKGDPYRDTYMVNGIPAPQWEGAGLLGGALLGPTIEASMVPKYLESQAGGDTAYDREFWGDRNHTRDAPAIAAAGIPALIWNGWDDAGFGGLELYTALQNAHFGRSPTAPLGPGSPVTGRYQLVLGNWGHGGGLDEGIQLQWYETWLKGVDTGLPTTTQTPIHVQEQVSGRWSNLATYPFTGEARRLGLGVDGALRTGAVPSGTAELRWAQPDLPGAALVFETAPFAKGATVAGPSALRLHASSTTTDLQLMADLYDVAPDGTATPISHGGVLGSMRHLDPTKSWVDADREPIRPYLVLQREEVLVPGQVVALDIPLRPTVWRLDPGHRLRLRIVGQEETARCLTKASEVTTDAVGCRARAVVQQRLAGATFMIQLGRGSFLNVPLLEAGALPEARAGATPTTPDGATLPLDW